MFFLYFSYVTFKIHIRTFLINTIYMNSKYGIRVFNNLQKYYTRIMNGNTKTPLGRWDLIYDHRMQKRIDRANEDHCGPCGSMYMQKEVNVSGDGNNSNDDNNLPNGSDTIDAISKSIPTLNHYERKLGV